MRPDTCAAPYLNQETGSWISCRSMRSITGRSWISTCASWGLSRRRF